MKELGGFHTLFDDDLVGQLMSATGADEFHARFMLDLYRGEVEGDAEFVNPPGPEDAMFPELESAKFELVLQMGSFLVVRLESTSTQSSQEGIGHRATGFAFRRPSRIDEVVLST